MFDDDDEQDRTRIAFRVPNPLLERLQHLMPTAQKAMSKKAKAIQSNVMAIEMMRTGIAVTEWYRRHAMQLRKKRQPEEGLRSFILRAISAGMDSLPDVDDKK